MSEYQYYQFLAIDRPLDDRQMAQLRAISTRAEITPTSFVNEYHWGDLKAEPLSFMKRYFDAHVYVANWGTRSLMLAVPCELIDVDAARQYANNHTLYVNVHKDRVILSFDSPEDDGDEDFDSGEGWLPSLLPLRDALMQGDLRSLYVAWLAGVFEDEEVTEPPVPPGLGARTGALESLIDFLRLEPELVDAAAEGGVGREPAAPSNDDVAAWVKKLPAHQKNGLLCELVSGEEPASHVLGRLRRRFQKQWNEANRPAQAVAAPGRTMAEVFARRETLAAEARQREAARLARKRSADKRKTAAKRKRYLDQLAPNQDDLWRDVDSLLKTSHPKHYDRAVALLTDLRDLAARASTEAAWQQRIIELRRRHARKHSLMKRFDAAGFPS